MHHPIRKFALQPMIVYSAKMDNYVYCQTGNMLVNEAFSCGISLEEMADYSHEIR